MERFVARKQIVWLMIFALLFGLAAPMPIVSAQVEQINGLVVPVQDEAGEALTQGYVYLYEKKYPGYDYGTEKEKGDTANQPGGAYFYTTQIYSSSLSRDGEAFIPSSYLLPTREYELVVSGVSAAGHDIFYHQSFIGRNVEGIDFSASKLTKTSFVTAQSYDKGDFALNVQSAEGSRIYPYYIRSKDAAGQPVGLYIYSNQPMSIGASISDSKTKTGWYLAKEFVLNGQAELEVNLDSELVHITAPQGFDQASFYAYASWKNVDNYGSPVVSDYYVTKGSRVYVNLSVTENTYSYSFSRNLENVQTDLQLQLGTTFTGRTAGYSYYGQNDYSIFTRYTDELGNTLNDIYYSPIHTLAAGEASEEITFYSFVDGREKPVELKAYQTEAGIRYSEVSASSGAAAVSSYMLQYEWINSSGSTVLIGSNSVNTISLPHWELGTFRLKLTDQHVPTDQFQLVMDTEVVIDRALAEQSIIKVKVESPQGYSSDYIVLSADLWEMFEDSHYSSSTRLYSNNNELTIYSNDLEDEKKYVLHVRQQLREEATQQIVTHYSQYMYTGAQLKALKVLPAKTNLIRVKHEHAAPDQSTALVESVVVNVAVPGTEEQYELYVNNFDPLIIEPGSYRFAWTGSDGDGTGYAYTKQVVLTDDAAVGYGDIKDQAVQVDIKQDGSAVPFTRFNAYDGISQTSLYHYNHYAANGQGVPMKKLMVTPSEKMSFQFQITEQLADELPIEYEYGTSYTDISNGKSFSFNGEISLAMEYFEQMEQGTRTQLEFIPVVKKGDLRLYYMDVRRPGGIVAASTAAQFDKRNYETKYNHYESVPATVKIMNSPGQTVYRADESYLSSYNVIASELPMDNYVLTMEVPVGYSQVLKLEQAFSVPLVSTPSKPEVQLSQTNEGLRIDWTAGPGNVSYEVYVAEKGQALQKVAQQSSSTHYHFTTIESGKTYQVKVVGVSRTGEKAESDVKEYAVPVFTATKLDVDTAAAAGSLGLLKIGSELTIALEGTHREGDQAKAVVHYTKDGANTAEVTLDFDAAKKQYRGQFQVLEGMTEVVKTEGFITDATGTLKTAVLTKELNKGVGATISGVVQQAGKALNGAVVSVSTGLGAARAATDQDGKYVIEGLPSGSASVSVTYNNETHSGLVKGLQIVKGSKHHVDVQVPVLKTVKLRFVDQGSNASLSEALKVSIAGADAANKGFSRSGYIGKDGYFTTYSGETELTRVPAGERYTVTVSGAGIYNTGKFTFTVEAEADYTAVPVKVEVEKKTKQATDVKLRIMFPDSEYGNITGVDYYSLYSSSVSGAFGYEVGNKYGIQKSFDSVTEKTYIYPVGVTEGVYVRYGEISVSGVVYSDDYQLYLNLDGYRTVLPSQPIAIKPGSDSILVEADPGVTLSGKLISGDKVIAGAYIYAYGNGSYVSGTSNTEGFTLRGLADGGEVTLQINAEGYLPVTRTITLDGSKHIGDIELEAAGYIEGRVFAADGTTPLMHASVSAYGDAGSYGGWARTDKDGYFKIRGLKDSVYQVTASQYGYPSVTKQFNFAVDTNPMTIVLQNPVKEGSFIGEGNSFAASVGVVIPGKNVQYRLNYKNNNTVDQSNVKLTVSLPSDSVLSERTVLLNGTPVTGVVSGGKLTVTVPKVAAGEAGELSFDVTVNNTASGTLIASAQAGDSVTMTATTNVLFVTLNAPAQTAEQAVKVYGSAKPGTLIEVFAGNNKLAEVTPEGRWWFAEVQLPVADAAEKANFELVAKVTDGSMMYTSEAVQVSYNPSIPKVTDVKVTAGWNGEVTLNPYTNVTTFAITEMTEMPVSVKFDAAVDEVVLNFLGKTHTLNKAADGVTFTGKIPYGWSSYGEQLLTMTFKKGDMTITLPLMEIIVLIDPSGYVFEGSMDNRLEGVTAVVEEETTDGVWAEWNAAFFGQVNPQTTDADGRYGWDVIQGNWRVQFTKQGYENYTSRIVVVPPAETMLNVPMVRTSAPAVVSVTPAASSVNVPANSTVKVVFDRPMNEANMDTELRLVLVEGTVETPVAGTWSKQGMNGYKEDTAKGSTTLADSNGETGWFVPDETKKLSKEVVFTPAAALKKGATYKVTVGANLIDYDGKPLNAAVTSTFTTEAEQVTPPTPGNNNPGGGYTGGIPFIPAVPVAESEQDEKTVSIDKSDLTALVKDSVVEITLSDDENTVVFDREVLQEAATKGYSVRINHSGAEVSIPADAFALEAGETLKLRIKDVQASLPQGYTAAGHPVQVEFVKVKNGEEQPVAAVKQVDVRLARDITLDSSLIGLYEIVNGQPVYRDRHLTAEVQSSAQLALLVYQLPLADLTGHWAQADVNVLVSHHIINGVSETAFAPEASVTRAQAAKLIAELMQLEVGAASSSFQDVVADAWYARYVAAVEQAGIFQGAGGLFRPEDTISRQELAVVISRLISAEAGVDSSAAFADQASIADWAQSGVDIAVQHGIIRGNEQGEFQPDANASRAQAAVMIRRLMNVLDASK